MANAHIRAYMPYIYTHTYTREIKLSADTVKRPRDDLPDSFAHTYAMINTLLYTPISGNCTFQVENWKR